MGTIIVGLVLVVIVGLAVRSLVKDKKAGKSILLISEELQELIGMCDRILILKDGEVTCEKFRTENVTEHMLIDYMI